MPLGFAQLLPKLHPKWQGYLDFMFFIQSGFNCDSVIYDMSFKVMKNLKRLAPICLSIVQLADYSWAKNEDQNTARRPCWLPRGKQVSHQRWIWGIHHTQAMKQHTSERSTLALKLRAAVTTSPKTGVSVAQEKGLMSFNIFLKKN